MMDISQVTELVDHVAYPLMIDSYERQRTSYQDLCETLPVDDDMAYGERIDVLTTMGRLLEREDGQQIQADEFRKGPTAQLKVRLFSRKLGLPERMVRASDAAAKISNLLRTQAGTWGEIAAIQKDDFVADLFQKGTLTAGSTLFFDNTFPGYTDSNAGFIYDGLPFFNTAHTITVGSSTYANHTVSSALTEANLQTVLTTMTATNNVDERGERVLIRPDTLVVPPGLEFTARKILESVGTTGSANNDINPVRGRLDVVVWDALDDAASASSWWVGQRGKGVRVRDSGQPVLRVWFDEDTKQFMVSAEIEFGAAVTNWRYWYCANKAAA